VLTAEVLERSVAERPTRDSLEAIAEWLVGAAREIPSGLDVFDEFAWRMSATGLPLLRVTLHSGTLHPQFLGTTIIWWRTSGQSELTLIAHEITDLIHYEDNPVQRVCIGGETLRRRLDVPDETLDFAVLRELKGRHATDYLALPIRSVHGRNHYYMVTYVTDRIGGFTAEEIADMTRVSQRLAIVCDIQGLRWVATNVLNAYLGPKTGPAQEALAAVRCLKGWPSMTDEPPLEIVVALHLGTVVYGNIGAAQRLDFTVIGPAVNLVSRLEAKVKILNTAIVVSDDFARAYGKPLVSLGHHPLRGLAGRHELFAPILGTQATNTSS
jgi:hypothetical protein